MSAFISSYCRITNESCKLDGKLVDSYSVDSGTWAKQLYNCLDIDYPKFHKMDDLAKFAFLATELASASLGTNHEYSDDEIGLCFANHSSSIVADSKFRISYTNDEAPSPGVFVYTLPNILMGEIAIRKKWFGDNRFLIQKEFDSKALLTQIDLMLESESAAILAGWVEVNNEGIDVLVFLVEKTDRSATSLELNNEVLSNLHQN